jgi:hypothetical protein
MRKRNRATVLGAIVLGRFCVPLAALADEPCSPLGLQCQAASALHPVTDPLEDAIDDVGAIVDDLAGQADDAVGPIVDDVKDVVDDVLGRGDIVDPPGRGGEGTGGDQVAGPGAGGGSDRQGAPRRTPPAGGSLTPIREAADVTSISAASGTREQSAPSKLPPGGVVEAAISGALLLLALFTITVGFVLLQDRLDRADPKLAIAPLRPEVVTFE